MKTKSLLVSLIAGLGLTEVQAQNVVVAAGVTVTAKTVETEVAPSAPAVVPVAVPVPVRVAPGCAAPLVYGSPYAYAYPNACAYPYAGYSPNVVYFGGPHSHVRNYYSGNMSYWYPYSPAISFGRGEAYERGYYYNWRR